jgi:glycosyltransferase involved in cell wall biosynthesis
VIAGNETIAAWFRNHARDVRVIHTAIDTSRFTPPDPGKRPDTGKFSLVWTGQQVTLRNLQHIEVALATFMARHADVELVVVTNQPPKLDKLDPSRIRCIQWTPEGEVDAIRHADVGLMPLMDDILSRAKCSFKMLQYMACGMPVVVTPVGLNEEILNKGADIGLGASNNEQWVAGLEQLYQNRAMAQLFGRNGRRVAEDHFSHRVIADQLRDLFHEIVPKIRTRWRRVSWQAAGFPNRLETFLDRVPSSSGRTR